MDFDFTAYNNCANYYFIFFSSCLISYYNSHCLNISMKDLVFSPVIAFIQYSRTFITKIYFWEIYFYMLLLSNYKSILFILTYIHNSSLFLLVIVGYHLIILKSISLPFVSPVFFNLASKSLPYNIGSVQLNLVFPLMWRIRPTFWRLR